MSVVVKYKGNTIASASTEVTKTLKTSGKYCEADILVENTPDGGDAPVINPLSITANGTYTAPSGVDGYSPINVNVPQGITPTGNINITDTNPTDVTNYATATVVDADLVASNIKKDVNILGVVGSFEGGGAEIYYDGYLATPYTPNMVNNGSPQASIPNDCFRGASHLESAELLFNASLGQRYIYDTPIKRIIAPNMGSFTQARCFGLNRSLQYVELGSIGHPVTSIKNDVFYNMSQSNLTILVYVDAQAISEIASGVISTAPWSATNATIVYKNSTTGEVLT